MTPTAKVRNEPHSGDALPSTLSLLLDLCAVSSESGNARGLAEMAARLSTELSRHGLRVDVTGEPGSDGALQPVLTARAPSTGETHLLLLGHMDTVLSAIAPRLLSGRLLGTGALDMKGGLAMLVGALDLLAARGAAPPADLLLVAVPDEEVEGTISERLVRRFGERARAVLVLEPGQPRGDGETLVAGRRGLTEWRLEVTGRGSHSGLAFWEGRSALAAAAEWSSRVRELSRRGTGPTVNIARFVAGTAEFVDRLASSHALLGTSRQRNVVPDRAVLEGETRTLSSAEGAAVVEELARLAAAIGEAHGVEARFTAGRPVPPVDPRGSGAALVRRAVDLAAARGFRLVVEEDRGGISFPNYLPNPGRVPVVDGLGPVGDGMHTRDEWLDIGSLERRIVLLADLLESLSDAR